jgi:hypothetical protein
MKTQTLSLLVSLFSLEAITNAKEKRLEYAIKRNGDVIGNIHFVHGIAGNRTVLTMESEVNTPLAFNFIAKTKEETIFDKGIMTWSSIFSKLNGNVKINKKTKSNGNTYTVYEENKTEMLDNYPIRYNMLSVYIIEPLNITKVYSDNFQQQIDIQKVMAITMNTSI